MEGIQGSVLYETKLHIAWDLYEAYLQQKEELKEQENLITEMHARLDRWLRARTTRSKSVGGETQVSKREGGGVAEVEAEEEDGSTTATRETDEGQYGYEEGLDLYD